MKISIIGYRNHSLRLKKLLITEFNIEPIMWNHNTDEFSDLIGSDAIIIASPQDTHVEYIQKILSESRESYIFCEKPPTTYSSELEYLNDLSYFQKEKIFFNFNYRFSELAKFVRSNDLGQPLHFNFISSHGLALKEGFKDNWRFKSSNKFMGVLGTVGIHYIDLSHWLLGDSVSTSFDEINISGSRLSDTATINMEFESGCSVNIFVSYATPFINKSELIFTNGMVVLDDGVLDVYRDRNTFDDNGNFKKPKKENIVSFKSSRDYYNDSLEKSLEEFIRVVKKRGSFSPANFIYSMASNRILLNQRS